VIDLASVPQIDFVNSLVKQLTRTGVRDPDRKLKLDEIRVAMKDAQTVEELPGAQASEWIEELLLIKQEEKR